ncbi:MAG: 2,3-bisphosphoglycerate-independent phosphoglycerate mutase [Pseudomonadota bacterium]
MVPPATPVTPTVRTTTGPVMLCILDGWGIGQRPEGDAPRQADTPVMDGLMRTCPNATLTTFGPDAGLPSGQMGNSEVGHTNIGAGRVVAMDLGQIDLAIEEGSLATRPTFTAFVDRLKASGGTAHLSGLCSPGGVHAHQRHIAELARILTDAGVPVLLHALTDGRDVPPKSALGQLKALEEALPRGAACASVIGRYYAMDRDKRWERVAAATSLILRGEGHQAATIQEAIEAAYERGETDEFITATRLAAWRAPTDGDGLLFANFRADRARELLTALGDPAFDAFDPGPRPAWAARLGMVQYSEALDAHFAAIFPDREIVNTLGQWVSDYGLRQFRLAETEKYPHVTFFLNGGIEPPAPGEDRFMPPSPKVATYDLAPEMAAPEVTQALVGAIGDGYDLIVVNYANPDMVGHTGDLEAAKVACTTVDRGLGEALDALKAAGGAAVICADHGNCETMIAEDGGPHTAHTTNPVPVILFGGPEGATLSTGRLADLAPTVLELMGLPQPAEMTGRSLITQ